MADIKSPEERSKNMSRIRSQNTKPELFIRRELFARGYRYRISPAYIPGHPDLFLRKYNLAVFVHGCFWHRHEGCKYAYTPKSRVEFWNRKFENNIRRDQEVKRLLADDGIRCLVIWECAVRAARRKHGDPEILFSQIESMIQSETAYREVRAGADFQTGRDNPDSI